MNTPASGSKKKPGPKPSLTGEVVRTSFKLDRWVWLEARKLALRDNTDLTVIVNGALADYISEAHRRSTANLRKVNRALEDILRETQAFIEGVNAEKKRAKTSARAKKGGAR